MSLAVSIDKETLRTLTADIVTASRSVTWPV
jgi:hypothetical protein